MPSQLPRLSNATNERANRTANGTTNEQLASEYDETTASGRVGRSYERYCIADCKFGFLVQLSWAVHWNTFLDMIDFTKPF